MIIMAHEQFVHLNSLYPLSNKTLCAIWYHLYNLQNVKNTHGKVLLLVCMLKPATLLKVTLLHGCFSRVLNCRNGTKSHKASQKQIKVQIVYCSINSKRSLRDNKSDADDKTIPFHWPNTNFKPTIKTLKQCRWVLVYCLYF